MNPKPAPVTPNALSIGEALSSSAPLARLREALRESNARFDAIRPALPPSLLPYLRAGPVDPEGWSLLASNASVAAKLRQLLPRFEQILRDSGWTTSTVRIKVASSPGP